MCIVGLSESGHGGRFEPCEECKRLQAENAALRQELESSQQDHLDTIIERDALRQERDRLAGIVKKADALAEASECSYMEPDRLKQARSDYQEARHAG